MKGFDFDWLAICALGRIRTLNPRSRNPVFYPVELRVHFCFAFQLKTLIPFSITLAEIPPIAIGAIQLNYECIF